MPLTVLIPASKLEDLLNVIRNALDPPLNSTLLRILPGLHPGLFNPLAGRLSHIFGGNPLEVSPTGLNHIQSW